MKQPTASLHFPEKLVGRQHALDSLVSVFGRASRGYGEVLLVPGRSGVGKTSLVHWLKETVASQNGWFLEGKFDQYQQNTPYYAIRQILSQLWQEMLSAHQNGRDELYAAIVEELGDPGALLVELVPELSTVFGQDSKTEEVGLTEARHRFTSLIRKFLNIACQPDHPVVLFVDDWQWADNASLELLKGLQPGTMLRYCLLIAAYRDDEVKTTHPLSVVITELNRSIKPPEVIAVRNLTGDDVKSLIEESLPAKVTDIDLLTRQVHDLTRGNPFYVKSFLEYLYEFGLLRFDALNACWNWHFSDDDTPDDITDLFVRRLRSFVQETQFLVSLAACLGNIFSLENLSTISDRSAKECRVNLESLVSKGLVVPRSTGNREKPSLQQSSFTLFAFMHDRVQQAAFLLISSEDLAAVRLKIGRQLLAEMSEEELEQHLFEILEHVNAGAERIDSTIEQKSMVALNMRAARKAKAATAFSAMLAFNRAAFHFAENIGATIDAFWDDEYTTALTLSRNLAESEFIEGDRDRAEHIIRISLDKTRTAVEKAETLNIMVVHYTLLARYDEAIAVGRQALAELGIDLPHDDYEKNRDVEIGRCLDFLEGTSIAALHDAPFMEDLTMRTATKLLITLGPPCYRTHQRLWSVIVPKAVNLTLQHGLMPQIGYSYTAFGGLLGWVNNDFARAKEFGAVAEQIMSTRYESPSDQSVFYLMIGSSTRHWFKHLRYASQDYLKAYDIGLKSGNLQYAAYAFGHNMYCSFYQGVPLQELLRGSRQSLVFSRTRLNYWAIDLLEGGIHLFEELAGETRDQENDEHDDSAYLQRVEEHQNIQVLCMYKVLKTFNLMLMGRNHQAKMLSDETEKLIYTVGTQGLLPWPEHIFCRFLILSALYHEADEQERSWYDQKLEEALEQLEIWAVYSPENYAHKYLLAQAEMQRIGGAPAAAISLYDQAIEKAQKNDYIQWEGLANERAYAFWRGQGNGNLEQIYWQQAYTCYHRWGAEAKLAVMEDELQQRLASWHEAAEHRTRRETEVPADNRKAFWKKHIGLLKAQCEDKLEAELHLEASQKTDELADATERLRTEVAERKRLEHERIQLEEQIRQRHKMEAIGTLAGGIAHEFNNMLTIIIGNIDLAKEEIYDDDPVMESLGEIQTASLRAKDVVQKLQRFARKSPAAKKPIRIKIIVEEVFSLLRKTIPTSIDVRLHIHCQSEMILADSTEMNQVLINLCNNAVHAIGESSGTLEVTVEPLALSQKHARRNSDLRPGEYVHISIKDTGCGIDPQIIDRVFDPYFTTKDVDEGLGMGLAVVLGIIKNHDGEITIESEPGQGTLVSVLLPLLTKQEEQPEQTNAEAIAPRSEGHILVVDDEQAIVNMTKKILERQGYVVTAQTDPEQALALFRANQNLFDLVLTDMTMPSLTGIQLSAKLKDIRNDIPVILYTGHNSLVDEKKPQDLGVEAIITKPLTIQEILETVKDLLESP